jgi:hypothetical protein
VQRLTFDQRGASPPTVAGLAGLILSGLAFVLADRFPSAMPADRAVIEGAVALPLLLLSAGLIAVGLARPDRPMWTAPLSDAVGVVLGVGLTTILAATTTQVACAPVTGPLDVLPRAAVVGLVLAVGWICAVRLAAAGMNDAGSLRVIVIAAVALAAVLGLALAAFILLFPALSCARV